MPKLDCPCGFSHNLAGEENAFVVVQQKHYPKLMKIERELASVDPRTPDGEQRLRELSLLAVSLKGRVLECPKCGRVIWFRGEFAQPIYYWMDE